MKLQRATNGEVAYGVLRDDDGRIFFTTVERYPIPAGKYTMVYADHPVHGWCYEIIQVPNRTGILLHGGNAPDDTEGCIVVGRGFANFGNTPVVVASKAAILRLVEFLGKKTRTLTIADAVV